MSYQRTSDDIRRDLYLRKLQTGEIQGPPVGKASVDKPWLKYVSEDVVLSSLPEKSIYDYVYDNNKDYLDRIAINYFDTKITYGEFFDKVDSVSKSLLNQGVREGDYVSIVSPTTPETIYLFYAIGKIGAIGNMIDPRASKKEIKDFINETRSDLLFVVESNDYISKIEDAVKETTVTKIFTLSPTNALTISSKLKAAYNVLSANNGKTLKEKINSIKFKRPDCFNSWDDFYNSGRDFDFEREKYEYPDYKANRPVVAVHTGGTTGRPKGVLLTHDNLNGASFQCENCGFDFRREHKWFNIMPMFIAYGVGNGLHLPLACGMEVIVEPQFNPEQFGKKLKKYKFNHVTGVPSHYDYLIESEELKDECELTYLLSCIMGGDKGRVDREKVVNDWFKEKKISRNVDKGYGMTEVTAAVAATGPKEVNKLGSCGVPFSHTVISVFRADKEDGQYGPEDELFYNEDGEVCITGPNVMYGYIDNAEEEAKILKTHSDGSVWIHSQDMGRIDSDGCLYIEDRMKNLMALTSGFKVYPSKIENVVYSHPAVEVCKTVGVQDPENFHGQRPMVYIVLKEGCDYNCEQIIQEISLLCEEKLPDYSLPLDYKIKEKLPLTKVGKIDIIALRNEFNEELLGNVRVRKLK